MHYRTVTTISLRVPLLIFSAFLVAACLLSCVPSAGHEGSDLEIVRVDSGIGWQDGNPDVHLVTYKATLVNHGTRNVYVRWVEPVLTDEVSATAVEENRQVTVDKTVLPGDSIVVTGQYSLKAAGESINHFESGLSGFTVCSEHVFLLHGTSLAQGKPT